MQTNSNTNNRSAEIDAIDKLDEIHNQTPAMLSVLMVYLQSVADGGEELTPQVLSGYAWQMKANIDRAEQATEELTVAVCDPHAE